VWEGAGGRDVLRPLEYDEYENRIRVHSNTHKTTKKGRNHMCKYYGKGKEEEKEKEKVKKEGKKQ
jgi:hypothetical protein